MAGRSVTRRSVADEVAALLDSPEVARLVAELDDLNWTGQKGYGARALVGACLAPGHEAVMEHGAVPVFARRRFAGEGQWTEAPECRHGTWTFASADRPRRQTKWRCPTGECQPKSVWIKAERRHPLIPCCTRRHRATFAKRGCVERNFGLLKNEYGLTPLRVRRRERVALHADLTMLARPREALARARAVPLAA